MSRTAALRIEKNIPIPPAPGSYLTAKGRPTIYPFRHMELGDSFKAPRSWPRTRLSVAATVAGNQMGAKFTIRTTDSGHRIWRIK